MFGFNLKLTAISMLLTFLATSGYNWWSNYNQKKEIEQEKKELLQENRNLKDAVLEYAKWGERTSEKLQIANMRKAAVDQRANEALRIVYEANNPIDSMPLGDDFNNIVRESIKAYRDNLTTDQSNTLSDTSESSRETEPERRNR